MSGVIMPSRSDSWSELSRFILPRGRKAGHVAERKERGVFKVKSRKGGKPTFGRERATKVFTASVAGLGERFSNSNR